MLEEIISEIKKSKDADQSKIDLMEEELSKEIVHLYKKTALFQTTNFKRHFGCKEKYK